MRIKKNLLTAVMALALLFSMAVPGLAEGEREEFVRGDDNYSFSIFVPNFIEVKTVEVEDWDGELQEIEVIVAQTPVQNDDESYTIFEIVADDRAAIVDSYPGIYNEGQAGGFWGEFEEGRIVYSPTFMIRRPLSEIAEDAIFSFNFSIFDEEYNTLYFEGDLNFVFVNGEEPEAGSEESAGTEEQTGEADDSDQDAAANESGQPAANAEAKPTSSTVVVNGEEIAFEAYKINNNNYFKLRDLAQVLSGTDKQFEVEWDPENNAILLTSGEAYTSVGGELAVSEDAAAKAATLTSSTIILDGEEVQFTAYKIGGNNYFKLRDVGQTFDFAVTWDGEANLIGIDTTESYTEE